MRSYLVLFLFTFSFQALANDVQDLFIWDNVAYYSLESAEAAMLAKYGSEGEMIEDEEKLLTFRHNILATSSSSEPIYIPGGSFEASTSDKDETQFWLDWYPPLRTNVTGTCPTGSRDVVEEEMTFRGWGQIGGVITSNIMCSSSDLI